MNKLLLFVIIVGVWDIQAGCVLIKGRISVEMV